MKAGKYWVCWLALCGAGLSAGAQSIQAMTEQIAALKAFIITAEKGYQIAEDGLHAIRDIKNGEFNLHSVFFSSLLSVNSAVRDMPQVAEIVALQGAIIRQFSNALNAYRQGGGLSPSDLDYLGRVYDRLVSLGVEDISTLQALITDGDLQMEDGDRIRRIVVIDKDMQERTRFVQDLTQRASLLAAQRQKEKTE